MPLTSGRIRQVVSRIPLDRRTWPVRAIPKKVSVPMRIGLATHSMTALFNQEFVSKNLSYTVSSVSAKVAEDFSVTLKFGAASAEEVAALASFTSTIQVIFAQMFDIDVSMFPVSSVEATSAGAVLIAFSATGSGLSMSAPCIGTLAGMNPVNRVIQHLTGLESKIKPKVWRLIEFTKNLLLGARRNRAIWHSPWKRGVKIKPIWRRVCPTRSYERDFPDQDQ